MALIVRFIFQGLGVTRCKPSRFQQEQREGGTHGVW